MKMRFYLFRLVSVVIVAAASASVAFGQYKGTPATKDGLIKALRSHQFQTRDFVNLIQNNGVDFVMTPVVEQELVAAGARPQMIAAAKSNYRAPAVEKGPGTNNTGSNRKPAKTGTPLSKDAIIALLENSVPDTKIRSD